ncbi:MAG: tRNA (adenosine(37)-N6)-threonylcarbamoyltransferase complex transferase subunit TsaD [Fulvimarina manganoxydans]|uniref:tRNA (adenosine(37)-N6)-threonylcarbamoyltransferase complex transferase subunit TsaD n=1 Tax=Fulvimarina manganoxydans TaxID=937218 RepID=UPI00235689C5|nr:tRNA (adenosine(37)-N6)-threonylcarbamoyltransferase complex transferase subunit TsaD [Fulvimarina manganoxydans]MCK5933104.1 tRNA (adenosine(37)-N6)-threonylcarbamoyltransferase complex transferase subunit TsaD [Fulvimarina manganoxydans]
MPDKGPFILGIETSCDETAAAVVGRDEAGRAAILANVVHSQINEHAAFGGVVPEIAARAHVEVLDGLVRAALSEADAGFEHLAAVAATTGPGLVGGLIVGSVTARAIAQARSLPFLAINHLEGHALTPRLTDEIAYPYLLLLVSGGHTQILLVRGLGLYERWGTTIDDALGEAFDKTAKLLRLGHPGGPAVECAAKTGDSTRFALPRPMRGEVKLDFSFSGLKTAVRLAAERAAPLDEQAVSDLCASFQAAAAASVGDRIARALARFREELPEIASPVLAVAGGVAANRTIRAVLEGEANAAGFAIVAPPLKLCTDNAAMIAYAGLERFEAGRLDPLDTPVRPRWPLDETALPVVGFGRRGAKV